ncbi:MAG: TonB-dependent receptor [Sideroxydans sp.]|nr:TonB-dependent receptor [Sideroxydans sp.]
MNKKLVSMSAVSLVLSMPIAGVSYAEEAPIVAPAATSDSTVAVEAVTPKVEVSSEVTKPNAHQTLSDVVVSASKISQSSVDAPANVGVFTAKKLEKTNSPRVGDALLAKVPGLFMRGGALGSGRPGTTAITSLRGQNGGAAVLVDGMNMADAYSGAINWSMVSIEDVGRIEVVPGAGSSLYGAGATAGVINITTKSPTKKEITFKEGFGFGDAAGQYSNAQYRNKFENGLGVSFGVGQESRDGYAFEYVTKTPTNPTTASPMPANAIPVAGAIPTTTTKGVPTYIVGEKGKNGYKVQNINVKVFYDLTPTSKINGGIFYTEGNSIFSNGKSYLTNAATGQEIPLSNVAATNININGLKSTVKEGDFYSGLPSGNNALRAFAGYETDVLGDNKLNVNVGSIKRQNWTTSASASATATTGVGTQTYSPKSITSNLMAQLTRPLSDSQLLVIGFSTELSEFAQRKYFLSNWTNKDSSRKLIDQLDAKSMNNSLFLQDQVAIGDALTLYVGGRFDAWKASADSYKPAVAASAAVAGTTTSPAVAAVAASNEQAIHYSERSSSAFSPKISAVYKVSEGFSIKSSLGQAFNAPSNYDLFNNPAWSGTSMSNPNPDLKPEKATSLDLGTEYLFDDGGNIKVATYVTETKDLVYSTITPVTPYLDPISNQTISQISQKKNTAKALAKGVELSGEYPLLNWLVISGTYAYTDAKIVSDPLNPTSEGKRMINVPKDMASVALDAEFGDWSGVLSARYVGEQFTNSDNSDVVKGVWAGYSKYSLFNLKTSYRLTHNLKASLAVDNLGDKLYYDYYRMPGRTTTLELAGSF